MCSKMKAPLTLCASPLSLGRWGAGNQPAPRTGPAHDKDIAFGLRALTEAKVGMQHPVPTCCPAGSRADTEQGELSTNPGATPEDALGRLRPQSSGPSPLHAVRAMGMGLVGGCCSPGNSMSLCQVLLAFARCADLLLLNEQQDRRRFCF